MKNDIGARMDALMALADADAKKPAPGGKYNAVAVQKEIEKDKRIKPGEAKLIHGLLKGWRGDAAVEARMDSIMEKADATKKSDVPPASHLLKEKATDRLWKITGVSMSGGRPVTVKVRAANYDEARQNAGRRGIKIESVVLQDGQ